MSKPYTEYTEQDIYNLKAENERLHYELGKKEGNIYKLQQLKSENNKIRKVNNANAKLMIRLRNCLDDIEKIVNKYKVGSGNLYGTIYIPDVIQIAEKIKEVKGNE